MLTAFEKMRAQRQRRETFARRRNEDEWGLTIQREWQRKCIADAARYNDPYRNAFTYIPPPPDRPPETWLQRWFGGRA